MNANREILIAAALITRQDGCALLVRKRGTSAFMQPGGKIDRGEAPKEALIRELHEELGLRPDGHDLRPLGQFEAPAANEPGFTVKADLFHLVVNAPVSPAAEIEEIAWVEPGMACHRVLAPLTRDHVLPIWDRLVKLGG